MASNKVVIEVDLDDDNAVRGFKRIEDAAVSSAKSASDGYTTTKNVIANLASTAIEELGKAAVQFVGQSIEIGKTFENSMSKVSALSGAVGEDYAMLEAKAREMGATTTFSASQAADALGYMALAGWKSKDMIAGLPGVLALAQAGEMDLAAASDLVTDYLSAFGMTADDTGRMVDVLAYAQANANTNTEQLGMSFRNCAANAKASGMDVETTTAAIAQLANQGLKGSLAGTALNAVLRDMTAKMEDGAIAIGETSVRVMDASGNYRDFADIIADVESAVDGMGDAERASALMTTFTADSIKGLNLMLNAGSGELRSFRDRLYDCNGAAQATADTMTNNLQGDLAAMNSAFEELALKIYDGLKEPLRSTVQFITDTVVPGLTFFMENLDKIIPIAKSVGAATLVYIAAIKSQGLAQKAIAPIQSAYRLALAQTGMSVEALSMKQKAQIVVTQAGTIATKAFSTALNLLKTAAPILILTAAVQLISVLGDTMEKSRQRSEDYEAATEGLSKAMDNLNEETLKTDKTLDAVSTEKAEKSFSELRAEIDSAISSQARLANEMAEKWGEINANSKLVENYTAKIVELTEKGELSAQEQAELAAAVAGYNEICGTSISIIDAQSGKLSMSTDEIRKNADAWIANARAQAAQQQLVELAKVQLSLEDELADAISHHEDALRQYNEAVDEGSEYIFEFYRYEQQAQAEVDRLTSSLDQNKAAQQRMTKTIADANDAIGKQEDAFDGAAQAAKDSAQEIAEAGAEAGQGYADNLEAAKDVAVKAALEVTGMTLEQFEQAARDAGVEGSEATIRFANGLAAKKSAAGASASQVSNEAKSGLESADTHSAGSKIMNKFSAGMTTVKSLIKGTAAGISQEAAQNMGSGDSATWGAHLVQNFSEGMSRAIQTVRNITNYITKIIAGFLQHTVPKEGPLANHGKGEAEWGLHAVQNFAGGFESGLPEIKAVSNKLATELADSFSTTPTLGIAWDSVHAPATDFSALGGNTATQSIQVASQAPQTIDTQALIDVLLRIYDKIPNGLTEREFERMVQKVVKNG